MTEPVEPTPNPESRPSLLRDLKRVKKLAKRAWWLGILVGLLCNLLPAEYRAACHAVVDACKGSLVP